MSNQHNLDVLKEKLLEIELGANKIKYRLEQEGTFHSGVLTKIQNEAKSKYRLKADFHFVNIEDVFNRLPEIYAEGFSFENKGLDIIQSGSGFIAQLRKPRRVIKADLALIDSNSESQYLAGIESSRIELTAQLEKAVEEANKVRQLIINQVHG